MHITTFHKNKYGTDLLVDLGRIEEIPYFFNEGKPHTVDFYEIFFLRKAKGFLKLDTQEIELRDRIIIYASPYQRRLWKAQHGDIEGYFLIFAHNFMELFFADPLYVFRLQFFHNHQHPLFLEEDDASFTQHQQAFDSIFEELNNLQSDSEDIIRAFLLLILAGHNRRYCKTYGITPERSTNQGAYQFKKLVEENIRQYHKVEDFAQMLNVSRVTLNKMAKAKLGLTATELIKKRLLTEIQRELLFTQKHVSEIAYELNFSEPSSLIRLFKNMEGLSPSEFRQSFRQSTRRSK